MKRELLIKSLMYDSDYGFVNIVDSTEEFKNRLLEVIDEARVSIPTVKTFLSFCEEKIKEQSSYDIDIKDNMFASAVLLTNIMGIDCKRINESLTRDDLEDLDKINAFTPFN